MNLIERAEKWIETERVDNETYELVRDLLAEVERLRAIEAKLPKPVTISRKEISQAVRALYPFEEIVNLLQRNGVEVVS